MSSSRHIKGPSQSIPLICFLNILLLLHHLPNSPQALSFNYTDFSNTQNLNFTGDAFPYRGILSLTKDRTTFSTGRVTYAQEFQLWDHATKRVANFSCEFSYNITSYDDQAIGADGLTFFVTPHGDQIPDASDGACLGLISHCADFVPQAKPVVAVEVDTFNNTWDPDTNHIGINVNSIRSVTNVSWPYSLRDGSVRKIRIFYDSQRNNLVVYMAPNQEPYPEDPSLSYQIDLSEILPEWVTVGFSGSTGVVMELHYIHSWYFESSELIDPEQSRKHQCVPWPENCSGAGNWFLFVLFIFGVPGVSLILIHFIVKALTGRIIPWGKVLSIISALMGIIAGFFGLSSCSS